MSTEHRTTGAMPPRDELVRACATFAGVLIGYLAMAHLSATLMSNADIAAVMWPGAGLAVGALLLNPRRRWWMVLLAVAVAELGRNLLAGYAVAPSLWWTAGNVVGPLVGALLVTARGRTLTLTRIRDVLRFVTACVVVGPLLGAVLGTTGTATFGRPWIEVLPQYLAGDALGVLVVTPVLLVWHESKTRSSPTEGVALAAATFASAVFVFWVNPGGWDVTLPYLMVLPLSWAALRFGVRGAALGIFTVAQVAHLGTLAGRGPFTSTTTTDVEAVIALQLFLGIVAVSTLVLAAAVDDLSGRGEVERRLRHRAFHDPLTGLPNRSMLEDLLAELLAADDDERRSLAVVMCDLDHFKVVNDGLGHGAGDELLEIVAARMRAALRERDLLARLGGDEFIVVIPDADDPVIDAVTSRMRSAVAEPIQIGTANRINVSMSVGVARFTPGDDADSLLRHADAALYRAKELGRSRVHRFDSDLRAQVEDRWFIEAELDRALRSDELFCVYQPEVFLGTGELFGFEALARWNHPSQGTITPDRFVPVMEHTGRAGVLFELVLRRSLRWQSEQASALGFRPPIAVNLSAHQLGDPGLVPTVLGLVEELGSDPGTLWLEVTEHALIDVSAMGVFQALRASGVRMALDDFGTGWSSVSRLAEFEWDALKVDRSFVARLGGGSEQGTATDGLVAGIIAMGHSLGTLVVAEGVETRVQMERLRDMGCDIVQGYLVGRPSAGSVAAERLGADRRWDHGRFGAPATRVPAVR